MPIARFILMAAAALLVGCGGSPNWQAPPADEQLIPEIAQDGTKFFTFQRDYLVAVSSRENREMVSRSQRGIRIGEYEVEARVNAILERTGYCRQGFFELYREQTFQRFLVRGECREAADESDRARFTGPIPLLAN
ncbi:hypothetical protein PS2015_2414 [Pseudohongiella spirulinae]|uniref:Lipoprotein n=1 Tax=Pseudohongiella spirulinae TaxID=1249552 RepID=A0A0S2KFG7_9GAMM|nr:hypothetical protein PS2015_2414 [Pseudohongiella spirulinae]